ncbi:MAG: glycosyltransferase family 4 protein [Steroidobacteraceae bacterium]
MSARWLEFVIPGDLQAATGGYAYDRRMIAGLVALGWRVTVHGLDASFPQPSLAALDHAQHVFASLPDQSLVLVDGLAGGAMPEILQAHASRLRLLALVHHPLAAEGGLGVDLARNLAQSERRALQAMRHVVVTSDATREALHAYGVDPQKISVVEPGTDTVPRVHPPRGETLHMLCVATLIPRKGHELLLEALAPLASSRWQLTCVGSLTRSPATVQRLHAQLSRLGLDRRVTLTGEIDSTALARLYSQADLFVLPTLLEGYGMAVAEALAHGVPVISTQVGAIAQLVGTDAGLLVPPGNTQMLRAALAQVLNEPSLLDRLTAGAAAAGQTLPGWRQACERMSQTLEVATAPAG